ALLKSQAPIRLPCAGGALVFQGGRTNRARHPSRRHRPRSDLESLSEALLRGSSPAGTGICAIPPKERGTRHGRQRLACGGPRRLETRSAREVPPRGAPPYTHRERLLLLSLR